MKMMAIVCLGAKSQGNTACEGHLICIETLQADACASAATAMLQVEVRRDGVVGRRYKAKGLTDRGPKDLTFHNEQAGREMTVLEYFETTYHIQCASLLLL